MMPLAAATVVVAALAVGGWYWRGLRGSDADSRRRRPAASPLLPFDNLGDAEQAYFAAGVTEEVTLAVGESELASRDEPGRGSCASRIPPRSSPTWRAILGIGAVLTGSVRHAGSQVRVGVQLLAAPSGESLW
jgi:TolB-like protein